MAREFEYVAEGRKLQQMTNRRRRSLRRQRVQSARFQRRAMKAYRQWLSGARKVA